MFFISLMKILPGMQEQAIKSCEKMKRNPPEGVKIHQLFVVLGQYDLVMVAEADSEINYLKLAGTFLVNTSIQTLTAIDFDESVKVLKDIYWFKKEEMV